MADKKYTKEEVNKLFKPMAKCWFVSYLYYLKIDKEHKNWQKVDDESIKKLRMPAFESVSENNYTQLLEAVIDSKDVDLNKTEIDLSAEEVKRMAKKLISVLNMNVKEYDILEEIGVDFFLSYLYNSMITKNNGAQFSEIANDEKHKIDLIKENKENYKLWLEDISKNTKNQFSPKESENAKVIIMFIEQKERAKKEAEDEELFWTRTGFFWVFIGAAYGAFAFFIDNIEKFGLDISKMYTKIMLLTLNALGVCSCFIWMITVLSAIKMYKNASENEELKFLPKLIRVLSIITVVFSIGFFIFVCNFLV